MRPSGHPSGPFHTLTAEHALPELLKGRKAEEFAGHLENAAADPAFPVAP